MTASVVIRRKSDGKYLTHWGGGFVRYGSPPAPFRSEGHAATIIRVDLGEDLHAFEILDAETVRVSERGGSR